MLKLTFQNSLVLLGILKNLWQWLLQTISPRAKIEWKIDKQYADLCHQETARWCHEEVTSIRVRSISESLACSGTPAPSGDGKVVSARGNKHQSKIHLQITSHIACSGRPVPAGDGKVVPGRGNKHQSKIHLRITSIQWRTCASRWQGDARRR